MTSLIRSLVVCNAMLLALPQGWCCYVPTRSDPIKDKVTSKAAGCCHRSSGPSCCRHSQAPTEKPSESVPSPNKPCQTCCWQAVAIAKPNPKSVELEAGFSALASISPPAPQVAGSATQVSSGLHFHSSPLYLINCLWLC
jgi:hypothetical protein